MFQEKNMKQHHFKLKKKTIFVFKSTKYGQKNAFNDPTLDTFTVTTTGIGILTELK